MDGWLSFENPNFRQTSIQSGPPDLSVRVAPQRGRRELGLISRRAVGVIVRLRPRGPADRLDPASHPKVGTACRDHGTSVAYLLPLAVLAVLGRLGCAPSEETTASERPNVLLVVTDD